MLHTRPAAYILGVFIAALAFNAAAASIESHIAGRHFRCGTTHIPHIPVIKRNFDPHIRLRIAETDPPAIGDSREFLIYPGFHHGKSKMTASLRAQGAHCYIYVENSEWNRGAVTEAHIQTLLNAFENKTPRYPNRGIYDVVTSDFGQPPDVDGNDRVILLILEMTHVGGYVYKQDRNNADIIYINSEPAWAYEYVAAHEFQHLIHGRYDQHEEGWINEGASELAEFLCGYANNQRKFSAFQKYPRISLAKWASDLDNPNWVAHYDAAYLWMLYLYEQYGGIETVRDIVQSPMRGAASITHILQKKGYDASAADVFVDWRIALSADSAPGVGAGNFSKYSFQNVDAQFNAQSGDIHSAYHLQPVPSQNRAIEPWAGHILEFKAPSPLQPSPLQFKTRLPIHGGGDFSAAAILYDENGTIIDVRPAQKASPVLVTDLFPEMGSSAARAEIVLAYHPPSADDAESIQYAYEAHREGAVQPPSVRVTIDGPSGPIGEEEAFTLSIRFSKAVAGFSKSDLILANAIAANFSGSGAAYAATIDPIHPGNVTAHIVENAARDSQDSNFYSVSYEPGGVREPSVLTDLSIEQPLSVAYSPDGETIASAGSNKVVILWDVDTGAPIRTLAGHEHQIQDLAYSPDGSRIVSGSLDRTVRIWNAKTGALIKTLAGHKDFVSSVAYSPDGRTIASGQHLEARIWNAKTGALIRTLPAQSASIAYSPDSRMLVCRGNGEIRVWKVDTGALIRILAANPGWRNSAAYSPDGETIASGSEYGAIQIWSAETGALLRTLAGHTKAVRALAFSPDSRALVSGSYDHTVKVWDAKTGALTATLTDHAEMIWSVAFSPDGQSFASGSAYEIRIWPFAPNVAPLATASISGPTGSVTGAFELTIAFSRPVAGFAASDINVTNGSVTKFAGSGAFYTATVEPSKRGKVEAYILTNADKKYEESNFYSVDYAMNGVGSPRALTDFIGPALSVAYSPDGETIASAGSNKVVILWDVDTGAPIRTLAGHEHQIQDLAYSPDGSRIVSGSLDRTVRIWNAKTGALIKTLAGHKDFVSSVAYSPDGRTIASGQHLEARIWNAKTGALIRTLPAQSASIAYSPDSRMLVCRGNGEIRVWKVDTGALIRILAANPGWRNSAAYSPDGETIASGSEYGAIQIWSAETGALLRTLAGHTKAVRALAFSPDSRALVSGSDDHTVKVWDAKAGGLISTLTDHTERIWSVAFSPDGQSFASGSFSEIRIWPFAFIPGVSVTISGPSDTVKGAFDVTITFSEAVAGFETSDINVTNGSVTKFAGSGASYTATIEPTSDGSVTVKVPPKVAGNNRSSKAYTAIYSSSLEQTLKGHTDRVRSVAYSPDGFEIASGSVDSAIRIWDAETGGHVRTLEGHTGTVWSASYSPDGSQLASGGADKTIRIWNAQTGEHVRTLTGHQSDVRSVTYSPDGSHLASGSQDNTIRIWNAETGEHIRTLTGHSHWIISAAYSPDGSHLASGSTDRTIRVWNAQTGAQIRTLTGHTDIVLSAAYSPDGSQLASGSGNGDRTIRVWNAETGALIRTLPGHTNSVDSTAYSPDGSELASAGGDRTIRIWNAETGAPIRTLQGHTDIVLSVAYSPDSTRLASGSDAIRIWRLKDAPDTRVTAAISGPTGSVTGAFDVTITFSEAVADFEASDINVTNGSVTKFAGSGASYTATIEPTSDGSVTVKVPPKVAGNNRSSKAYTAIYSSSLEQTLKGHTDRVRSVAYSPDGFEIASGSVDSAIRIWDAETGGHVRTLEGHTGTVWSASYSPDGSQLASGGADKTIRIWNAQTGEHVRTLTGHQSDVRSVTYSPDGSHLASGSQDNTIRIWNAETGEHIRTLTGHSHWIISAAYSPDGSHLASGSTDRTIRVWNAQTGAQIRTLTGHTDIVLSAAYSPDGSQLASGSGNGDRTIRVWNAETGALIRTLPGHTNSVDSTAYSPDGSELASAGGDRTIRIWNAETGAPIRTLQGHTDIVLSVAYSPDSTRLASGSDAIRIWRLKDAPDTRVTAAISGPTGSVTGAFDVTITFSEAVADFEASDINVTNGAVTNLAGSGAAYTATIKPSKPGAVTVSVPANAAGNNQASNIYTVEAAMGTTFTMALNRGLNLIHVPVKDERLSKVSDLYNALGGASDVQYIVSYIPSASDSGSFAAYFGIPGSFGDMALSDQTAAIVNMRTAKKVSFTGGLLNDTVALTEGVNLIGVPRAEAVEKASGVAPNAAAVVVLTTDALGNAWFSLVVPNTPSDVEAVGGQGYMVVANADDSIAYAGKAWADPEDPAPATAAAADAVKFDPTIAPVLLVEGMFAREDTLEPVNGLQITIRNLRTGESVVGKTGMTGSGGRFAMPMIALRGSLYQEGDTLEASAVDPSGTFGGWTPVRAVVGKDEIAAGRIDIGRQLLSAVPSKTALFPNYPNPFNPETWIPFDLAESSRVRIAIYNSAGQTVRVLELGQLPAGAYRSRSKAAHWDGRNALGEPVASGIYYAYIEAGSFTALRRMLVLK